MTPEFATTGEDLLEVVSVRKHFPVIGTRSLLGHTEAVRAVDDVSLGIRRGETLALVGESGSGKSVLGRLIVLLYPATSGQILYEGVDLTRLDRRSQRAYRRKLQMIFQDPYASLDPKMKIKDILAEPLVIEGKTSRAERDARVRELLDIVGLDAGFLRRRPRDFSGGQRQRIGIARALALAPDLIVADEPVSSLDVSVQAQILNLLKRIQQRSGMACIFIAHDLSVTKYMSDRVAVMYLGKIVELAETAKVYANPLHPYTVALLSAVPIPDPVQEDTREQLILRGEVPSAIRPPSGCRFHTRCPIAEEICHTSAPPLSEVAAGHFAACHFPGRDIAKTSDSVRERLTAGSSTMDSAGVRLQD